MSATQVRLITDKGNQYYPIGYMEQGRIFVPLPLNSGRVVDDFVQGQAVQDWVFQVKPDEKPTFIEMKELRVALSGAGFVKDVPVAALAVNSYPQAVLQGTFDPGGGGRFKGQKAAGGDSLSAPAVGISVGHGVRGQEISRSRGGGDDQYRASVRRVDGCWQTWGEGRSVFQKCPPDRDQ